MVAVSKIEFRMLENILVQRGSLMAATTYETLKYFDAVLFMVKLVARGLRIVSSGMPSPLL
jgi:hypothetical protein